MHSNISVEEVYAILDRIIEPSAPLEAFPLREAFGRILMEDVSAPADTPLFTNSAMDGFAFRFEEIASESRMPVCGTAYAGAPFEAEVPAGAAVRIMTGAPVPEGLDTVIPFEAATEEEGHVLFTSSTVKKGANVRLRGEELKAHEIVLTRGTKLTPEAIGLAASFGRAELTCSSLRIGVFSTGDELRTPGEPLGPGQIWASNGFLLEALLSNWGFDVVPLGILPDDEATLEAAIRAASSDCDILVTTGGVGAGDHDQTTHVLSRLGEIEHFNVRMRPGRPLAFGYLLSEHPVFFMGLPGNPVAAAVSARIFLARALRLMNGLPPDEARRMPVTLSENVRGKTGRTDFVRGILSTDAETGTLRFAPSQHQSSAMLSSLVRSNALLLIPENIDSLKTGDKAEALLL